MSVTREIRVPDIGDFKDIPIIEVLVKPGDAIQKDAPLVVLESDKATLDVPSPEAGIVKELKVALGDRVSLGAVLLLLETTDGQSQVEVSAPAATPIEATAKEVTQAKPSEDNIPAMPLLARVEGPLKVVSTHRGASPSIRRFAREMGIDLNAVNGSGPRGRIVKSDLQAFVKTALSATASPPGADGFVRIVPWPKVDFAKFGPIERLQLTKIRRLTGENLARNWVSIPHVTNFDEADITDLERFRTTINAEGSATTKITLLSFLIRASAATLRDMLTFNASLDGDGLVLKKYVHIGAAVDTPAGLLVPVIRNVDQLGIRAIAEELAAKATAARAGKLSMADMEGGCFTISSLGGVGGTGFTPIINAPELAILGVGKAQMRPRWDGAQFMPRLVLPLCLSWDHRALDGAAAARFLVKLVHFLEDFRRVSL